MGMAQGGRCISMALYMIWIRYHMQTRLFVDRLLDHYENHLIMYLFGLIMCSCLSIIAVLDSP